MSIVIDHFSLFLSGLSGTLQMVLIGATGSLMAGMIVAVMRMSTVGALRWVGNVLVEVLRNCPLPVVLFFFAFGLPAVGFHASYLVLGLMGLVCYEACFVSEAVISGFNTINTGQGEAARALGLGFAQTMRTILLPQALRNVIPPLTNVLISLVKDTAIVGALGVGGDLFAVSDTLISERGFPAIPVVFGIIAGYLIIILPLGELSRFAERRMEGHR